MLDTIPSKSEIEKLIGSNPYKAWDQIIKYVDNNYVMDILWEKGRKDYIYEMKFRKSGKTLCALYPKTGSFGFMVIYGKLEREKFEEQKAEFSKYINDLYDEATTYHDGKWIMVDVKDITYIEDMKKMLIIKKKPNKKAQK